MTKQLSNNQSLIIKEADKGGNVGVWPVEMYVIEAKRQLNNNTCYLPLPTDPTEHSKKKMDTILRTGKQFRILAKSEVDFLTVERPVVPTFYLVPKVHKSLTNPPGRPIVSGIGGLCENVCTSIDFYLQPHVLQQ